MRPVVAVIPARGGSRGLPGKNVRSLAGLPLIAHSIRLALQCPEIERVIVSTDDPAIAEVARAHGAEIPFIRPSHLAADDTPMWPVVRHALATMEANGTRFGSVLLLDPTSPGRLPEDVTTAVGILESRGDIDAVFAVSKPDFNPLWVCVVERDGLMVDMVSGASEFARRQDVPVVYRINAALYLWRGDYVRRDDATVRGGRTVMLEIPEVRAMHIDDELGFLESEMKIREGIVRLPWLKKGE